MYMRLSAKVRYYSHSVVAVDDRSAPALDESILACSKCAGQRERRYELQHTSALSLAAQLLACGRR